MLFYDEDNKDSYDSNHAVIFKNIVFNLNHVIDDIKLFYVKKGIKPIIYQSICDDGYFEEIKSELLVRGFEIWNELQKYMVLSEQNTIIPNANIVVQKVSEWKEDYGIEIFEKAGEPWEIDVIKKALENNNTLFFVAFYKDKPVGMTHCHITDDVCRVDYLLVSKECRNIGVGRALINYFVEYCKANKIDNCYLWPDGETAERIYYEAGFRILEIKQVGRAVEKSVVRKSLGEALKEHRSRNKKTQEFVAETIGVSRQAVSKWESGTSDPSTSNLFAIAKLYGISVEELLKEVE